MGAAPKLTEINIEIPGQEAKPGLVELASEANRKDAAGAMAQRMHQIVAGIQPRDCLRTMIMSLVADERYDKSVAELREHLESRPDFPMFKERAERLVKHAEDLIQAVRAKRNFPGFASLNMSKQKDLFEKAVDHFEELKVTLAKIEVIEKELKVEDLRSTVWVVQTFFICIAVLISYYFIRDLSRGMIPALSVLLESWSDSLADWIFQKLGL
ncbi:MAG TPA: hypothetical protein PLZ57_13705 [Pseudobdellovibrionaceae bacterium]|nr:hypothetical protein [Pseudobdellovibrionaceae bacterium]